MFAGSIKFKLIATLSVILVLAFMVVSVFNYQALRTSLREEILTRALPLTRDNIYSEIHSDLTDPILVSSAMANDTFLKDWVLAGEAKPAEVISYLKAINTKYDYFTTFFVSARTGRYYYHDGILKKISQTDSHDAWYFKFIDSGLGHDLDVDTNQAEGNVLTIFINFRVEDEKGDLLGVTGVGLKLERMDSLISEYQTRYRRRIYLTNAQGVVQVSPDASRPLDVSIRDLPGISEVAEQVLGQKNEPAMYLYEADGNKILLTVRYVPELDWFLMVEENESAALTVARGNFFRTLGVGALVSLIIIGLSILTVNYFQGRLERMTVTDELTGVANRRGGDAHFLRAAAAAGRHQRPLSLILMDLDRFKPVNDILGHIEGDRVLKAVVELTKACIRGNDFYARWGGDEFVILTEGGEDDARSVAERIREAVAKANLPNRPGFKGQPVTVSLGIAQYLPGESLDSLTARADSALYQSKEAGRDRISVAG